MSQNDSTTAEPVACPYLGLASDPTTRFSFPAQAHRCHAGPQPTSIDATYQSDYCLSSRYPTCDRYHAPATNAAGDPTLSAEAAVAAEAEAFAEATGVGGPVATEPVAAATTPEPSGSTPVAPEPGPAVPQPDDAAPGSTLIGAAGAEPQAQRAAQATWTRHGWSTPQTESAADHARSSSEQTDAASERIAPAPAAPTEPQPQRVGQAIWTRHGWSTPESEAAVGQAMAAPQAPESLAGQAGPAAEPAASAEPVAASAEPVAPPSPPEPTEPESKASPAGRRQATPPPTEWKTAKTSSVLAAILPSYDLATAPSPSDPETGDSVPVSPESVAIVPPQGRRSTTPPPSAWKKKKTTSILAAILPPVEMFGDAATTEPPPTQAPEAESATQAGPVGGPVPAAQPHAAVQEPETVEREAQSPEPVPEPESSTSTAEQEPILPAGPQMGQAPPTAEQAATIPEQPAAIAEPAAPIAGPPTGSAEPPAQLAAPAAAAAGPTMPVAETAAPAAVSGAEAPVNPEVLTPPPPTVPPPAAVPPPTAVPPPAVPPRPDALSSAVWPPAASGASTVLPASPPAVPPRKRPWFADATPVADARARLPESAPLAGAPGARTPGTQDRRRFRRGPRSGNRRNIRRRLLLLLVVLAVAALAAGVATGSLERLLPAGLFSGVLVLPSASAAQVSPAGTASPFVSTTPAVVASPSQPVSPTPVPSTGEGIRIIHIVQPGESLTSIAAEYGVTPQAISHANGLKDPNVLQVGQRLIIPTSN